MMKFIILFTSSGCHPCKEELSQLKKHNKLNTFNHKNDRFMIVDLHDPGHRIWVELFQPSATPSIKIIENGSLKILKKIDYLGCIDKAWEYLGYKTQWLLLKENENGKSGKISIT